MAANSDLAAPHYFVRHGVQGEISRFRAVDGAIYRRGQQTVCQTAQGLLIGEVLAPIAADQATENLLLRPMTGQDHLLQQRLERYKSQAVAQCRQRMAELSVTTQLLDVEHLFDGRTLLFYFLGEVPPELEALTNELAAEYEKNVRTEEFAKLLQEGCGPGCGTSASTGSGCGSSGGCAVCVASKVCKK